MSDLGLKLGRERERESESVRKGEEGQ